MCSSSASTYELGAYTRKHSYFYPGTLSNFVCYIFSFTNSASSATENNLIFWLLWRSEWCCASKHPEQIVVCWWMYGSYFHCVWHNLSLALFLALPCVQTNIHGKIQNYTRTQIFSDAMWMQTHAVSKQLFAVLILVNLIQWNIPFIYTVNISPTDADVLHAERRWMRAHTPWVLSPENHTEICTNLLTFH